jgi:hypothetical protein
MKHRRVAIHLAWMGVLLFAVAGVTPNSEGVFVSAPDAVTADLPASDLPALDPPCDPPATDEFTPVACRMEPQCWANADCVAWCGPTGGRCVHSKCPIRICKCN